MAEGSVRLTTFNNAVGEPTVARVVDAAALHRFLVDIFVAAGAEEDLAGAVADALVDNHLAGHDSHGIVRVPQYLAALDAGEIDPTARPEVTAESPTTALVDGRWAFGQVTADLATELLIDKVQESAVASVAAIHANHTGRLAVWTERAARRGVAMFMTIGTVGAPLTAPFGGAAAVLGTNPVAFSLPNHDGAPVTLDYATSAMANGKILIAQAEGRELPPGVVANRHGEPTTDPQEYADGGFLLPFGGHKGYALAVIAELLGSVLTGSDEQNVDPPRSGLFLFGVAEDAFRSSEPYQAGMSAAVERITATPPAPGHDEVLVPGMPEARTRAERTREGIPLGDATWRTVLQSARALGVEPEARLDP